MTTGTISPSSSFWLVRALNCLQNSMMLICACPSAGPTGGAGVALPAGICSFTDPVTFFAIWLLAPKGSHLLRHLLHLAEVQLHRRAPPEDGDHDFQRLAVFVHF